jgi:hypothetical protein
MNPTNPEPAPRAGIPPKPSLGRQIVDLLQSIVWSMNHPDKCHWQRCPTCGSVLLNGELTASSPLPGEWIDTESRLCEPCRNAAKGGV